MRILLITPRYHPETFSITRIAETLAFRGHDITVITGKPNYGKWKIYDGYEKINSETINNVKVIRLNEKPRKKGVLGLINNYISNYKIYKRFLKKHNEKYDLVFSHILSPLFTFDGVEKYCKRNNTPHFAYGLDIWPESFIATGYFSRCSPMFALFKKYSKKIYKSCDLIAYASPSVEDYLKQYLKLDIAFKHIYQPTLTSVPDEKLISNHLYKKDGKLKILFIGTIARFNHLDIMIRALAKSKNKNNVILNIVGSGSDMDVMQKLTSSLQLEETVIFHGRVPANKTISHFVENDILFVPLFNNSATSKMIPQKLIEYFMYKRPILGMIKGDGSDLIQEASTLNVIADQTPDDLCKAVDKIYSYTMEDYNKSAEENYNFFVNNKRFLLETIVDEIEDSFLLTQKIYNEKKKD